MNLYRITFSGEAYVLADDPEDAQAVIESQVHNSGSLGLNFEASGPVDSIEDVDDWAWRDVEPYAQRFDPELADKTVRQLLEGK